MKKHDSLYPQHRWIGARCEICGASRCIERVRKFLPRGIYSGSHMMRDCQGAQVEGSVYCKRHDKEHKAKGR